MKRCKPAALLALCLCLTLLFTSCWVPILPDIFPDLYAPFAGDSSSGAGGETTGGASSGGTGEGARHPKFVPYVDMVYQRPDTAATLAKLGELAQQMRTVTSFSALWACDEQAAALMDHYSTMATLAELKSYHDTTDPALKTEREYCTDGLVSLTTAVNELNAAIVASPFAREYEAKVGHYLYQAMQADLLLYSPQVEAYRKERAALSLRYDDMYASLTVAYNGQSYTFEDIMNLYGDDYYALVALYCNQYAAQYAELYGRMVELDNLTAETLGFDSAADMYYLSYDRDYSPADARALFAQVKQWFLPMVPSIFAAGYSNIPMGYDQTMQAVPAFLRRVDPELADAWGDLVAYGLYDFAPDPKKQQGIAFTTVFEETDAPFIYMFWQDDYGAARTILHEFGHFYDFWLRGGQTVTFNLDVAETYSTGLELLSAEQAGQFTPEADKARRLILYYLANTLIYQSLLEEMQFRVYELADFSAEAAARVYTDLLVEYGFASPGAGPDNTWFQVSHLFAAPFYTVSYVTSAGVSLQIWEQSRTDWDRAAATYLTMIHEDQNQPFATLVEGAGLQSPFADGVMRQIAQNYAEVFGLAAPRAA